MLRGLDFEGSEKIHYREHMRDLDTSLRLKYDDVSVEMIFKIMAKMSLIPMYVEHSPPITKYSQSTVNIYGIQESFSTIYPEFEAHSVEGHSNEAHSNVAQSEEGLEVIDLDSLSDNGGCQESIKKKVITAL